MKHYFGTGSYGVVPGRPTGRGCGGRLAEGKFFFYPLSLGSAVLAAIHFLSSSVVVLLLCCFLLCPWCLGVPLPPRPLAAPCLPRPPGPNSQVYAYMKRVFCPPLPSPPLSGVGVLRGG